MFKTEQTIYAWTKSDNGNTVESHRVQYWDSSDFLEHYYTAVIFDEIKGLKFINHADVIRFSLDERDQQPLMLSSTNGSSPNAPTAMVDIPTQPVAGVEHETQQTRRHKANATHHERHPMREGRVEA